MDVLPLPHLKRETPQDRWLDGRSASDPVPTLQPANPSSGPGFIAVIVLLVVIIIVACTAVFFLLRDEARHNRQANGRGWYSNISSALGPRRSARTQGATPQSRSSNNRKKQGWTQVEQDAEAGQDPPFTPPRMDQRQSSVLSSTTSPPRSSLRSATSDSNATHITLGGAHARQPSIGMVMPYRYNSYNSYNDTHSFYSTAPIHPTPTPAAAATGSSLEMDAVEARVLHSPAPISVAASTTSSNFGLGTGLSYPSGALLPGPGTVGVGVGPAQHSTAAASDGRRLLLASSSAPIFIPDARSEFPTAHSPPASPSPSDFDSPPATTSLGHGHYGGAANFLPPRIASPEPLVLDASGSSGDGPHPARSLSVTSGAVSEFPTQSGPMVKPRGGSKFIEGL